MLRFAKNSRVTVRRALGGGMTGSGSRAIVRGIEDAPRPIRSSAAALGWAITTLRGIADALEAADRKQAADALVQLTPALWELERRAELVLLVR